jgi:hypothetical protein
MSQSPYPSNPPQFTAPDSYRGYGKPSEDRAAEGPPGAVGSYTGPPLPPPAYPPQYGQPPSGQALYGPPAYGQASQSRPPNQGTGQTAASMFQQPGWQGHRAPQRPGSVTLAAAMAVTASLQWLCVVSFLWLVVAASSDSLGTVGPDGAVLHMLNRFDYRMVDGLAWPLYLLPVAAALFGFALLGRGRWSRVGFSVAGLAALVWSAWWMSSTILLWVPPAAYIALACALVWTPAANRWFGWRADEIEGGDSWSARPPWSPPSAQPPR